MCESPATSGRGVPAIVLLMRYMRRFSCCAKCRLLMLSSEVRRSPDEQRRCPSESERHNCSFPARLVVVAVRVSAALAMAASSAIRKRQWMSRRDTSQWPPSLLPIGRPASAASQARWCGPRRPRRRLLGGLRSSSSTRRPSDLSTASITGSSASGSTRAWFLRAAAVRAG